MRDSIPVENILRAYMDETVEEDIIEEIKEQIIEKPQAIQESDVIAEGETENNGIEFLNCLI